MLRKLLIAFLFTITLQSSAFALENRDAAPVDSLKKILEKKRDVTAPETAKEIKLEKKLQKKLYSFKE